MKNTMTKTGLAVLITLVLMGFGTVAQAGTFEGTVQGFTCLIHDKVCPVDRLDPHVAAERLFVVAGTDRSYFFISNIDRSILARHVLEKVKVTGKTSPKYKAIEANKLEVYNNGSWRTIWSAQMQKEQDAMLYLGT